MGSQMQYCNPMRQLACQPQVRDSSKSTGHSHRDAEDMRQASSSGQCFSASSGKNDCDGKCDEASIKAAPSLGTTEVLPDQKADYTQSVTYLPYTYMDPYYGGVMAAYGPHAMCSLLSMVGCILVYDVMYGNQVIKPDRVRNTIHED